MCPLMADVANDGNTEPALLEALTRLNAIGASINRINWGDAAGVEATLRLIVESAIEVVPGASAVIFAYSAPREALDPALRVAAGPHAGALTEDAPRPDGLGARAVRQRQPVLSYETPDLEIHPAQRAAGAEVVACLPLVVADQPLGVLYVSLHERRRLSELELLLLNNFVNQAAMAIHHAGESIDVRRNLARKEDELTLLRRAGLLISSRSRLEDTLEAILQMALEVTGARYGSFRLVDSDGRNLVMRAIAGDRLGQPAKEALPINTTSITGWVAVTRRPLNIADLRRPPWSRIYYPLDRALEMYSELAVPLIGAGGRLEGVLNLESPQVAAFSEADSHLLQSLAVQAVIAIQEVRLLDGLREIAERLLTQDIQSVLARLVELAVDLMNARAGAVWTAVQGQPAVRAASAHYSTSAAYLADLKLVQRALATGSAFTSDRRAELPYEPAAAWTHALVMPVMGGEGSVRVEGPARMDDPRPLGAFVVHLAERQIPPPRAGAATDPGSEGGPSEWDSKVLGILSHYAALALANATRQQELAEAQEARGVAETFAAMGDIAANLLHHINNKVGAIPVRVEGIQDKCASALAASPYLAANLAEIERDALDAMAAVRERLSLLRPIERAPVSMADCVADALAGARLPAELTVATTGLDRLPPVMASREGLVLVIVNLLDNAAEALGGRGQVSISGLAHSQSVELAVSDNGPGIAPELQRRIFEFDFSSRRGAKDPAWAGGPARADPDREDAVRAKLGFGLWWVKTLMTRLGGAITVESDGQRGATFRLRLPRVEDPVRAATGRDPEAMEVQR
jgi:signal transduction histidine kinase/putative methionine-R-sulfoxide reductase with GAF domain